MAEHNILGSWGEHMAADYLRSKGYTILQMNWRIGHRDIDIVAKTGDVLVFVEVKTRRNYDYGDPTQAINYKKYHSLKLAANAYCKIHRIEGMVRFDVVTVVGSASTGCIINHMENAINAWGYHY